MSSTFNLSQFLQEARNDGALSSEGSFTLSAEAAREKLAKFALPPGAWVNKLLQSVVGWKVKILSVHQLRDVTIFHFDPSFRYGIPKSDEIWDCFCNGNIGGQEPLQRFCLALHALRAQEELSFLLLLAEPGTEPTVFADGVHLKRRDKNHPKWSSYLRHAGLTLVVSHFTDHERRRFGFWSNAGGADVHRRANIAARLQQSALGYPIALELDSRRLDKIEFRGLRHNKIIAIRPIQNPGEQGDLLIPLSLFEHLENEKISGTLRQRPHCLGLLLLYQSNVAARGKCLWIDHGVVLERWEIPSTSRLNFTLLLSAAGLPTDLTGLKLTQGDEWKTRVEEVSRQTETLYDLLQSQEQKLYENLGPNSTTEQTDFSVRLNKLLNSVRGARLSPHH